MVPELLLAVFKDNALHIIQSMIASGEKIDVTNDNRDNILHFAAVACNLNLLKWCLSQPSCPNINAVNDKGVTPLMSSCTIFDTRHSEQVRFELVSYLSQFPGIVLNVVNSSGYSADEIALENGLERISDYLKLQMLSESLARSNVYIPSNGVNIQGQYSSAEQVKSVDNKVEFDIVCYDRFSCN